MHPDIGGTPMIIDSQVHTYEADHPGRPWRGHLPGPDSVTGDELLAAMDDAGVDAAIIVSAFTMYRYDPGYAVSVRKQCPGRFALIAPMDINNPAIGEIVDDWAAKAGTVGIRIFEFPEDPGHPGLDTALRAATRHSLAVNLVTFNEFEQVRTLARRHPDCQFAIDHLGILPPRVPPLHPDPFRQLPRVLDFAQCTNIAIKISGSATLSAEPYPFNDLWDPLARIFDAFGFDRCMWGSDWTRCIDFLTYREAVDAFRLTDRLTGSERAMLMGGALTKVYGWNPG